LGVIVIHIEHLKVSGFKSIRELRLKRGDDGEERDGMALGDLNVLIGANGTGKSNLLSFFDFLSTFIDKDVQLFVGKSGGASRLLYYGRKVSDWIAATLQLAGPGLYYEWKLVPAENDALVFEFESELLSFQHPNFFTWGGAPGPPSICDRGRAGSREPEGLFHDNDAANKVRERFGQMAPFCVYHFSDTSIQSPARQAADLNDNKFLRPDGKNLAAILYLLKEKHPLAYRRIEDAVRLVLPYFEKLEPGPLTPNERLVNLEWRESGFDGYRDAWYLPDGALRFICLATLLLQPESPGLILIDEPELGLHPYAIGVLAELLRSASRRSQVMVSTQSATLVSQLEPEDVIVVEREKEVGQGRISSPRYETVFKRLDGGSLENWLEDYSLGDLFERNLLGGRPSHG
jgi:predicted ATPase